MIVPRQEVRIEIIDPEIVHQLFVILIGLFQRLQVCQVPKHVFFGVSQMTNPPIGDVHILVVIGQGLVQESQLVLQGDVDPQQEILP